MNSRERVKLALSHQQPDRPPLLLWMVPEILEQLKIHFGVNTEEDVLDKLDIDVRWLLPDYVGPELKVFEDGSKETEFGYRNKAIVNEFGTYEELVYHPLATAQTVKDVHDHPWPDPDWWDYSGIKEKIAIADRLEPRWLGIGAASFFERSWAMTGFEKLFYDLVMNPALVEAIMDHMMDFYLEQTCRILEAAEGRIDMVYIADDLSGQEGLLISPEMFDQFLKGRWKKFNDTIKERFGDHIKFHYHCCGAIEKLIPGLIEMGVDILNPIQPKAAGMEPQGLKDNYGKQLSFCGGLDIQDILPNGTPQEVKTEAKRLVRILGKDGGYIASAAHAVQADTSLENILAMVENFKTQ
ncbi:MAG: hypothetical protein DRQ40_04510 [Gammaproteobacteria bacterium]|nr:MAG: hypothetical protein DRQ40_04510 [Gammaproteobacteria bacterium]